MQQTQNATLTVNGDTVGGDWHVFDDTRFTATQPNTGITGGEWELKNRGMVLAERIDGGNWTVESSGDGQQSSFGVDVTGEFNPDILTVQRGTITCQFLGGTGPVFPIWDLFLKGRSTVDVDLDGWHEGPDSILQYEGFNNAYVVHKGIEIGGPLRRVRGGELLISVDVGPISADRYFRPTAELVDATGAVLDWDPEGVTVHITEGNAAEVARSVEAIGPDYAAPGRIDFNPDNVLFCDSPCVKRWAELVVRDFGDPVGASATHLLDSAKSTPISGNTRDGLSTFDDAVYVIDLTIEQNARLVTQVNSYPSLNIYYTRTLTPNPPAPGSIVDGAGNDYVPTLLTVTTYGDFDGDKDNNNDVNDVLVFNAHFPCGAGQEIDCYNPLVDSDCDFDIDCDDRSRFLLNWPNTLGLDNNNCP